MFAIALLRSTFLYWDQCLWLSSKDSFYEIGAGVARRNQSHHVLPRYGGITVYGCDRGQNAGNGAHEKRNPDAAPKTGPIKQGGKSRHGRSRMVIDFFH